MACKDSAARKPVVVVARDRETPFVTLRDEDLVVVAGGSALCSAVSTTIKAMGDALSTAARKG